MKRNFYIKMQDLSETLVRADYFDIEYPMVMFYVNLPGKDGEVIRSNPVAIYNFENIIGVGICDLKADGEIE